MKYGLYLPNFGPYGDARRLAALGREAEDAGWDGFFLWDHIAEWALNMIDPWVALAAVAANTQKIRIGTTVTPLPRRRPWKVAREAVSLDHLSGGRFTLGVGIGGGEAEWGNFNEETDLSVRGVMLDEALEVLVGLWQGEPFRYEGKYYQVKETRFLPKPLQLPRIPIWVGGNWPNKAPFRRAARWDGMFPLLQDGTLEEETAQLKAAVAYVRAHRERQEPFDIISMGITPGGDRQRTQEIVQSFREAGATWWLELIAPFISGRGFEEEWPLAAMRQRVLQGPPTL